MADRIATDEFGTRWFVSTGDPAHAALNYLERRGMRFFVLPRAVFLAGPDAAVVEWLPLDPIQSSRLVESVGVLNARRQ